MTNMFIFDDNASGVGFDMPNWGILNDFTAGNFGPETSTRFILYGAGVEYIFTGTGFTYDTNGIPTGGTITHLRMGDTNDGFNIVGMADFSLTVPQLKTFALTNDVSGLDNAILGSGGDFFHVGIHRQTLHLIGTDGDDTFRFEDGDISTSDTIDGKGGTNTAVFAGNNGISGSLLIQTGMLENIQDIRFVGTIAYTSILFDPNISGGKTLTIDAHALGSSTPLTMYAYYQTVKVNFIGGAGKDTFYGGTNDDQITGGLGGDVLTGFTGNNTFIYHSAKESTGTSLDAITDFDASKDHFQMPHAVNAIDTAVTTGVLDYNANFDADLQAALNGHLHAGDAILFTPDSGNLAGFTFLVVDQNGHAGYQSGHDIVIQVDGLHTNLTGLSAANFIV